MWRALAWPGPATCDPAAGSEHPCLARIASDHPGVACPGPGFCAGGHLKWPPVDPLNDLLGSFPRWWPQVSPLMRTDFLWMSWDVANGPGLQATLPPPDRSLDCNGWERWARIFKSNHFLLRTEKWDMTWSVVTDESTHASLMGLVFVCARDSADNIAD